LEHRAEGTKVAALSRIFGILEGSSFLQAVLDNLAGRGQEVNLEGCLATIMAFYGDVPFFVEGL
jgi:hypothetical protein